MNAQAVKFSLDRIADPTTRSAGARSALGDYKETEVVNDYTVKIRFNSPWAGFLNMCTTESVNILSPAAVKKWGDQYQFHITGTGPFMIKEYVADDHLTLVRNPNYNWGPSWVQSGPANLDSVTYKFIPEDLTRVSTLKTGETNVVDNVRSHDMAEIQKNPNLKTKVTPVAGGPWILNLNVQKAPTSDINIRKAMEYAIDRDSIVKLLYVGTNEPSYQPLEKNTVGYDPALDKIWKYDAAMAKKILDNAGWKVGSDGIRQKDGQRLSLIWVIWTGGGMEEPSAVVQDQLRQVGIEAVIETYDVGTAFGKWNDKNALNIAMPFCVYADPSYMQSWYGTRGLGSVNWQHLSSPELDGLLVAAEKSADPKVRSAAYAKVSKWLLDNAIVVPLFGKSLALGMKKNIEGISYDTTGYPMWYGVYFTK
jgi:peptide/nickel transport system substrate-binding protein